MTVYGSDEVAWTVGIHSCDVDGEKEVLVAITMTSNGKPALLRVSPLEAKFMAKLLIKCAERIEKIGGSQ